jgi:hypothetical protein
MIFLAIVQFATWLFFTRKERDGNLFHPIILFSISFLIAFFQNPLFYVLGIEIRTWELDIKDHGLIPHLCALSLWALSSMYVGYFVFAKTFSSTYSHSPDIFFRKTLSPETSHKASILFLIPIIILGTIYYLTDGWQLLTGHYLGTGSGTFIGIMALHGAIFLIQCSVMLQLPYLFSKFPKTYREIFLYFDKRILTILILFLLPCLFGGSRVRIIMLIMLFICPFFTYIKPLRFRSFIIFFLISLFCFHALALLRNTGGNTPIHTRLNNITSWANNVISPDEFPTNELAGTNTVLNAYAYYHYNETEIDSDHFIGKYTLYNSLLMFPCRTFCAKIFGLSRKDFSVEEELNKHIFKNPPYTTYFDSTSLTIPLLDFGGWGITFMFFLFGILSRFIEEKALQPNTNLVFAFAYSSLPFVFFFGNRSDLLVLLLTLIRTSIYFYFMFLGIVLLNKKLSDESVLSRQIRMINAKIMIVHKKCFKKIFHLYKYSCLILFQNKNKLAIILGSMLFCIGAHFISGGFHREHHFNDSKDNIKIVEKQVLSFDDSHNQISDNVLINIPSTNTKSINDVIIIEKTNLSSDYLCNYSIDYTSIEEKNLTPFVQATPSKQDITTQEEFQQKETRQESLTKESEEQIKIQQQTSLQQIIVDKKNNSNNYRYSKRLRFSRLFRNRNY